MRPQYTAVVRLLVLVVSVFLTLTCRSVAGPRNADADAAALRRLLSQFDRDADTGNLEAMMAIFPEDVILFGSGQPPVVGKAAVRAFWQSVLEQFNVQGAVHELGEITNVGDAVVLRGRARGSWIPRAGGNSMTTDNWFLHVYKRQADGSLVLWRGAFGGNAPAPATPK